jgi:hypothetical protein
MADKKVSELTAATTVSATDLFYVVQSSTSKYIAANVLFQNIPSAKFSANVAFGSESTISSAGIVDSTSSVTKVVAGASNFTCSIAPGMTGQLKLMVMSATAGGNVTVGGIAGNAVVVFEKMGHSAQFLYTGNLWYAIGGTVSITFP